MMYITHENGVITGVYSGTSVPNGALEVPDSFSGSEGMEINRFDENWEEKTLRQLFEEGVAYPETIYGLLSEIDIRSLRPLRAILAGTDTEYDRQKLKALEEEASHLRSKL